MIPAEFISELNERTDLADLVGAHVQLKRQGPNWVGLCPFHNEKTPSFGVNPSKGFYHCFGCGANGNAIGFLQQHYGLDFLGAVDKLAAMHGLDVPRKGGDGGGRRKETASLLATAMQYFQHQLRQSDNAKNYLKQRGLVGETAKRYKIGYAPNEWHGLKNALATQTAQLVEAGLLREKEGKTYDYFRNRIIFPIIDGSERVCGFGGRALSDEDMPKYLNSAENRHFSKRHLLYGLPQAMKAARDKKRLIICEGYMDVVMLAQAGFAESVATMGTAATAEQMKKAMRHAPNIYLAYDGDAAGRKGAFRALEGILPALKDGIGVFFLFLPSGHDPDSFIRENGVAAFEQLLAEAIPLGDYLPAALMERSEAASPEGRATGAIKRGAELLRQVSGDEAGAWRSALAQRLEQTTGISITAIKKAPRPSRARPAPNASYRMPPQSILFNLLCCLAYQPRMGEKLPMNLPLPGGGEMEVLVVSDVINKLRWHMDEEDEEGGEDVVIALLEKNGYTQLARQVQASITSRFSRSANIEDELEKIVNALLKRHERITRPGRRRILEELRAGKKGAPSAEVVPAADVVDAARENQPPEGA